MLETPLIRSRAIPSDPPRRRGATSLGPEKDRFGVLKAILAAVPWLQAGMGIAVLLLAGLVSRTGELFLPPNPEVAGRLPQLSGPDERVRDVISMARTMSDKLMGHDLGFSGLSLERRGAWTLRLSNGIEVVLGRDQVAKRFERFITVYENRLISRSDEVSRVDARYTNGVAVQWKPAEAASGPKT